MAVNPWRPLDSLYSRDTIAAYRRASRDAMPPHIFAIAEAAYLGLMQDGYDQTILVSGESGAGKTESTRHLMEFFSAAVTPGSASLGKHHENLHFACERKSGYSDCAHLSCRDLAPQKPLRSPPQFKRRSIEVQQKLLQANPLLETFGNAQTL